MTPRTASFLVGTLLAQFLAACGGEPENEPTLCTPARATAESPSDDPADYQVDSSVDFQAELSAPRWVVPSSSLPAGADPLAANNNVEIRYHDGRLFMAWRTAPTHFASDQVRMVVVSSPDNGDSWALEHVVDFDTDLREPRLLSFNGELQLIFFEAGTNGLAFEPKKMWRSFRCGPGVWQKPNVMVDGPEVPWDIKVRGGLAYMSSYQGAHYSSLEGEGIDVLFKSSTDGRDWQLVDGAPNVYQGGVSETAFEFAQDGSLWIVTRNEDGDDSGLGSHVCVAPKNALSAWDCPDKSDPERYDSPEMFRHGDELYLVARRDIGGPFGEDDSLVAYSLRAKTTALYRIDQQARKVVHLFDLPGAGDTAFPSIHRTGPHDYLLANYTSPLDDPLISWLDAQLSDRGTQLYLATIHFEAK